jgi:hypothetical protein
LEFEVAKVKILKKWGSGLAVYFLAITGTTLLIAKLSVVVFVYTIVLARPYLEGPRRLSLIQQRRIDAALALPPSPVTNYVVPSEVPTVPTGAFAAQLDLAEKQNPAILLFASGTDSEFKPTSEPSSIAGRSAKIRVARTHSSYVSANDIFNRSFGVLTVASR